MFRKNITHKFGKQFIGSSQTEVEKKRGAAETSLFIDKK